MSRNQILAVLFFLSILAACQEPMDPVSFISKLRVLAVQADPPEARPGERVTHRVLYADPEGKGREITFIWVTCAGLLTPTSDISGGCDYWGMPLIASASDGGDTYEITVPSDALDNLPESSTYLQATTIMSICAGGELPDLTAMADAGISMMNFDDLCVGGDGLVSFKTFRVSNQDDSTRNTNPTIASLTFNANRLYPIDPATNKTLTPIVLENEDASKCADVSKCPQGTTIKANTFVCDTTSKCLKGATIHADLTEDSFEFYEEDRQGEMQTIDEAPYVSWFSDGGELSVDRSRTAEPPGPFKVIWSPPQKGGKFTLYVVAHDLRGGTSWQQYAVEAVTSSGK